MTARSPEPLHELLNLKRLTGHATDTPAADAEAVLKATVDDKPITPEVREASPVKKLKL